METLDHDAPDPSPAAKVDPETLVLRARPARAIRFRRGLVVALVGVSATAIVGTAWFALQPASLHLVAGADDQVSPAKAPSDSLSGLPTGYAAAPKLGPPLPGDLGRPILDRQRQLEGQTGMTPMPVTPDPAADARTQRLAALKAARESGLLVQTTARPAAAIAPGAAVGASGAAGETPRAALDPDRDPNGQLRKNEMVSGSGKGSPVNPYPLMTAPSPYTLSAGSVIAASLITGLRSDLPGLVTAQVTENVYDSATGRILLVPQGARLIGSYDSVVAFGQKRALVVWQRIILPDGRSLQMDNVPATDPSGYAGLEDKVDFHTWALLRGVVLSTLLGVGAELQFSGESDLVQALRQSTQQSVTRAGDQLTSRNLQIQPTITIRPGAPVRLVVHRDLVFAPVKESQ